MSLDKRYGGYRSFSYLEAGKARHSRASGNPVRLWPLKQPYLDPR